jgi:Ig-like domain from next to BRCA1 gene
MFTLSLNLRSFAALFVATCLFALLPARGQEVSPREVPTESQGQVREPYQIGAWYFTAWSRANNDVQPRAAADAYQRWDSWGGIRDFVLDTKGFPEYSNAADLNHFPHDYWLTREPLLGFYDDMGSSDDSQSIMDAHILQAASHGLTYFAFYWYWYPTTDPIQGQSQTTEPGLNRPLRLFLNSKYKNLMKFTLAPIMLGTDPDSNPVSPTLVKQYVIPKLLEYARDSSFLKDSAGRPVIILFNQFGYGNPTPTRQNHLYICNDTCGVQACAKEAKANSNDPDVVPYVTNFCGYGKLLKFLRAQAMQRGLQDPALLYLSGQGYQDILYNLYPKLNGLGIRTDGAACFQLAPNRDETYEETAEQYLTGLHGELPLDGNVPTYIPCATTGFDARDWLYADGKLPHNTDLDPSVFLHENAASISRFEAHLRQVKHFMDTHPQTHGMMTLYAFNEWGEGGVCEPSMVDGYACLDDIAKVFGLISKSPEPTISSSKANFVSQAIAVSPFVLIGPASECAPLQAAGIPTLDCPLQLPTGSQLQVVVTFQNTGPDTWDTTTNFFVAQVPRDTSIRSDNSQPVPVGSILADVSTVSPGDRVSYQVSFSAPSAPGNYRLELRMSNQGESFGDVSPDIPMIVTP